MTKQELIKSEYIKIFGLQDFDKHMNHLIDENGWYTMFNEHGVKIGPVLIQFGLKYNDYFELFDNKNGRSIRPITLRGIEDNNGWFCMVDQPIPNEIPNAKVLIRFSDGSVKKFDEEFSMFQYATHWRIAEALPQPLWNDGFTELLIKEMNS